MIKKYVSSAWSEIDNLKKHDGSAWVDCDSASKYNATTQAWEEAWSNVKELDKSIPYGSTDTKFKITKVSNQSFSVYYGYGNSSMQMFAAYVDGVFVNPTFEVTVSTNNGSSNIGTVYAELKYDNDPYSYPQGSAIFSDLTRNYTGTVTRTFTGTFYGVGIGVWINRGNANQITIESLKINGQKYNIADALQKTN